MHAASALLIALDGRCIFMLEVVGGRQPPTANRQPLERGWRRVLPVIPPWRSLSEGREMYISSNLSLSISSIQSLHAAIMELLRRKFAVVAGPRAAGITA